MLIKESKISLSRSIIFPSFTSNSMGSLREASALKHVRRATMDDLPRIAQVAAAGFFHSPVFRFQRPYHHLFPEDTLISYLREYEAAILNPKSAVIVAEDEKIEHEASCPCEGLCSTAAAGLDAERHQNSSNVIVGVCSVVFSPTQTSRETEEIQYYSKGKPNP